MPNILVINCGSSSIKYAVIELPAQRTPARGQIDRLGSAEAVHRHEASGRTDKRRARVDRVEDGVRAMVQALGEVGKTIHAVGHRVVHGADRFREAEVIDDPVLGAIDSLSGMAPLHNPANVAGIRAARDCFPDCAHVAVFDTAFFQTLPARAYRYAVPEPWVTGHGIRRYGFHGTSHKYVTGRAAAFLKNESPNLITLHLGNGCSMACVRDGRATDTTMGFTPLEGLVMGTRSGDIDAGVIFHLLDMGMDVDAIRAGLEREGGLLGVSGLSSDVRDLLSAGRPSADRALDLFVHRIRRYLGAYLVELPRCDALVFTGGIGENAAALRGRICADLDRFGIVLDPAANGALAGGERAIHAHDASIAALIIPTNEELEIAKETAERIAREG